jgi:pimeloyl-ACP methyl ester carboxylesterase
MHRTQRGVLAIDLDACRKYAGGLDAAAAVRCPSLVLLGARDLMAPGRNAKSLIETLPKVRATTLPECGHALMSEQPDAVLDALRAFLVRK